MNRRCPWGLMLIVLCAPAFNAAAQIDPARLAGQEWYGLYMNGQKAGYAMHELVVNDDGSVTFTEDASFKLNMVGTKQDMRISSRRTYAADGRLASIESQVEDISGTSVFRVTAEGDMLRIETTVGGETKASTLPHPNETLQDVLQGAALVLDEPEIGKSREFALFEPMYQSSLKARSEIVGVDARLFEGVVTRVYKIDTFIELLGLHSISFVTGTGVSLEDHIGGMLTMRLEPEQIAKDVEYQNDVIVSNAARIDTPIDDPRGRPELRLTIRGPLAPGHLITDNRQSITGRDGVFDFVGRHLPESSITAAALPIANPEVAEWLAPSLFVQSDHSRLVAASKEIVGNETDAFKAAAKLSHWVYENVIGTFSARLTNSLEVLDHMEGDCTEHSMLFIGLARAAGLPAREAAGLIYVDDPQPGFYFHQWASVWVGQWIDVDPTFDQPIADATHIKLAEGDLFKQVQLLPIIGQLNVSAAQ